MKDIRYQYIPLTIAAAQAANSLVEEDIQLDRSYNRITGIAIAVIDDGGLTTNLLIGARSNRRTIVDQIPVSLWEAGDAVGPNQKYLETNVGYGSGDTFFIQATPLVALSGDAEIYMVLRLEADLTEIPRV
jgi:hypothetical protein